MTSMHADTVESAIIRLIISYSKSRLNDSGSLLKRWLYLLQEIKHPANKSMHTWWDEGRFIKVLSGSGLPIDRSLYAHLNKKKRKTMKRAQNNMGAHLLYLPIPSKVDSKRAWASSASRYSGYLSIRTTGLDIAYKFQYYQPHTLRSSFSVFPATDSYRIPPLKITSACPHLIPVSQTLFSGNTDHSRANILFCTRVFKHFISYTVRVSNSVRLLRVYDINFWGRKKKPKKNLVILFTSHFLFSSDQPPQDWNWVFLFVR